MTLYLEVLDDPTEHGYYVVEVCEYPAANKDARAYHVFQFNGEWVDGKQPARNGMVVHAWFGPVQLDELEALEDPEKLGYYVVLLQPWPNTSPNAYRTEICIWRRGAWYDKYGWAKQYGNVLGWLGPLPMLRVELPWVRQHQKEEAEDIGL